MKTGISFMVSAFIFLVLGIAAGETAETFRGIPWGADKKEFPDLVEGPKKGDVEAFTRAEPKKVGDIPVESVYYLFYRGKFGAAMIIFQGASNFSGLLDALSQKYGPAKIADRSDGEYAWEIEDMTIFFEYSKAKNRGSVNYFFKPLVQQREKDRAKARKKAMDDL